MSEQERGRWEDLIAGQELGPLDYRVTPEAVRHYCSTLGISAARYDADSPIGAPIVPPALVATDYSALLAQVLPPFTGMRSSRCPVAHARHGP